MALDKIEYKIGADSSQFRRELKKASKSFDRFQRSNRKSLKRLSGIATGAATGVAVLGAAAATAAVALGVHATKAAAGFERAIVSAGAKSGATADQLDQMGKAAMDASSGAEFSAKEAADAMGFLAAAGFDVTQQMKALPGVLNLASAGELDLASSADLASNVLKQFSLDVGELTRVNDVLVLAANSSNSSVAQLGEALGFAGPAAKGAGFSIEETVAAIGKLGDAGIQGGRAGTGLVQVMIQMDAAAKKMGVPLSRAEMASLGLAGSLQKLADAGLTARNAGDFFTSRAQITAQALLSGGIPAVQAFDKALQNAGGTAKEVADKKIDTLQGSFNILTGNLDTLAIALGQQLAPATKIASNKLAGFSIALRENESLLKSVGDGFVELIDETAEWVRYAGLATNVVITFVGVLGEFGVLIGAVSNTLKAAFHAVSLVVAALTLNSDLLSESLTGMKDSLYESVAVLGDFGDSTNAANEAGTKLQNTAFKVADELQNIAAKTRAATSATSELEKREGDLNRRLEAGNLTTQERIDLENELIDVRKESGIEGLKAQARGLSGFEQAEFQTSQQLKGLKARRDRLKDLANQAGLSEQALSSLSRVSGLSAEENARIGELKTAWAKTNTEIDYSANALGILKKRSEQAYKAQEKLNKLGGPGTIKSPDALAAPKVPTGVMRAAGAQAANEFAGGFAAETAEDRGIAALEESARIRGAAQATSMVAGFTSRVREAEANDIFAGYDRKVFEEMSAKNAVAMGEMIADQKALADKWEGIWAGASDKVVSVFADSVGDAFLGVLEGNVGAVEDAVKGLIVQMAVLAAKAAILSAIQSSTPGAAIPSALGFAGGGHVSGPGTGTSDSIPAYLSNDEYVMTAAATRHWGVGYMDSIKNMKTPESGRRQRFASGGLVKSDGGGGGGQNIQIINAINSDDILNVMASPGGTRVIFNSVSSNKEKFNAVLA